MTKRVQQEPTERIVFFMYSGKGLVDGDVLRVRDPRPGKRAGPSQAQPGPAEKREGEEAQEGEKGEEGVRNSLTRNFSGLKFP